MTASASAHAWNGGHADLPRRPFDYGADPRSGRWTITSSVPLSPEEVARIDEGLVRFRAAYAIARPSAGEAGALDIEYRAARPFERIKREGTPKP